MTQGRRPGAYKIDEAVCPTCGRRYTAYLDVPWSGGEVKRIRCPYCREHLGMYPGTPFPRMDYDIIERGRL